MNHKHTLTEEEWLAGFETRCVQRGIPFGKQAAAKFYHEQKSYRLHVAVECYATRAREGENR